MLLINLVKSYVNESWIINIHVKLTFWVKSIYFKFKLN